MTQIYNISSFQGSAFSFKELKASTTQSHYLKKIKIDNHNANLAS